MVTLKHTQHLG